MKKLKFFLVFLLGCIGAGVSYAETYTGLVTDSITGEELPFISIQIEGTLYGDETDIDGKFSINAEPDQSLIFNFLGYETKTVPLRRYSIGKSINVKLKPTDY
ncbi:MAG: carboxypeptidase-like regulatory domain-containing protein, partial [Paludibacteraceae bacterium]|nr:carboxypeptidase-like regulatory domain-containing protein [Paludibacteraceae bacterium]